MIAKAKSISHGANGMDYAISREEAEIIDKRYVTGNTGKEIKAEFKVFQDLNGRCEKNDISIVVSPEISSGKKLTNDDFLKISRDFLKQMGLENHQSMTVKHQEKEHIHLHIYANRIDMNGNAYKDNFISKKAQRVADEIAKARGMIRVRDVQLMKKEETKDIRNEIHRRHKAVMQHKPRNFKEYSDLMKASKVDVIPTVNKQGKTQGFRVEFQGLNFKASEIHRSISFSKTLKEIEKLNAIKSKSKGFTR